MDASVQAVAGVRLLDSYMTKRVGVPVDQLGRVVTLDKLKWLLSKPSHPYIEYLSQATGTLCKIYLDKDINCGKEKPSSEFYWRPVRQTWRTECVECYKKKVIERRKLCTKNV